MNEMSLLTSAKSFGRPDKQGNRTVDSGKHLFIQFRIPRICTINSKHLEHTHRIAKYDRD